MYERRAGGKGEGRGCRRVVRRHAWMSEREREKERNRGEGGEDGRIEKGGTSEKSMRKGGRRVSGAPKGRTKSGRRWARRDYLPQSKRDKLSVCISAWSGPITLFYPPGLYVDLLVGRWTRYFGVIYGHVTVLRGAVKLQNAAARMYGVVSGRGWRLIPLKPIFVATWHLKAVHCDG